jgi:hypothetical protein
MGNFSARRYEKSVFPAPVGPQIARKKLVYSVKIISSVVQTIINL